MSQVSVMAQVSAFNIYMVGLDLYRKNVHLHKEKSLLNIWLSTPKKEEENFQLILYPFC